MRARASAVAWAELWPIVRRRACSSKAESGQDAYSRRVPEKSTRRIPIPQGDASVTRTQGTANPVSLIRLTGERRASNRSLRTHARGSFAREECTK
eukprot:8459788-Heterocapsa_arctica.AAC.1